MSHSEADDTGAALWLGRAAWAPPLILAVLVVRAAFPLPVYDPWDIISAWAATPDWGFWQRLSALWRPFVDQRMVLPKLVVGGLWRLFRWRGFQVEIALSLILQLALWRLALRALKRDASLSATARSLAGLIASALLFWPYLLISFQHSWYATQYALCLSPGFAALLLWSGGRGWRSALGSLALAAVAATSHGTGAALLPILGLTAAIWPERGRAQRLAGASLCFAAFLGLALTVPPRSELGFPPYSVSLRDPLRFLGYFSECFAPRVFQPVIGPLVLLALCGQLVWAWRSGAWRDRALAPWLGVLLWGLAVAAATALSRAGMGRHPSRVYYAFFHLVFLATALLSIALWARHPRAFGAWRTRVRGLLLALLIAFYLGGVRAGLKRAFRFHARVTASAARLRFYPVLERADLSQLFPHARFEEDILPRLIDLGAAPPPLDPRPLKRRGDLRLTRRDREDAIILELSPPLDGDTALGIEAAALPGIIAVAWDRGQGFRREQAPTRRWFIFPPGPPIRRLGIRLKPGADREGVRAGLSFWSH